MVECSSEGEGWGEDGEGWDENGDYDADEWGAGEEDSAMFDCAAADIELMGDNNGKNYRVMQSEAVSRQVEERMEELTDLYALEPDPLFIIARHYKWSSDRMQEWFNEQDQLKFKLGLEFDQSLVKTNPGMNASLP